MSQKHLNNINKVTESFCENNFTIRGKLTGKFFCKLRRLPYSGASANLFEVLERSNNRLKKNHGIEKIKRQKISYKYEYLVAKLYDIGLSKSSCEIYRQLNNTKFIESFIDYSIINIENIKLYFGLYKKIKYNSKYIPCFFSLNHSFNLLTQALNYIHSKKIIHNDIKPNNIMCTEDNIILIDFEFAIDTKTKKKETTRTLLEYTHPNTLIKKYYIHKNIDVWAAVCSLFEIFFGVNLIETAKCGNSDYNNYIIILNQVLQVNKILQNENEHVLFNYEKRNNEIFYKEINKDHKLYDSKNKTENQSNNNDEGVYKKNKKILLENENENLIQSNKEAIRLKCFEILKKII